jgi:hypothetical protein
MAKQLPPQVPTAIPFDTAKHALMLLMACYADDNGLTASEAIASHRQALRELRDPTVPVSFATFDAIGSYRNLVELSPESRAKLESLYGRFKRGS